MDEFSQQDGWMYRVSVDQMVNQDAIMVKILRHRKASEHYGGVWEQQYLGADGFWITYRDFDVLSPIVIQRSVMLDDELVLKRMEHLITNLLTRSGLNVIEDPSV